MTLPAPPTLDAACANCGAPGVRRYCPECGQAAVHDGDYSLRAHGVDLVEQVATVDGKAARTFWALVARPGLLTADHLAGRRARYLRPIQLFLLVNVLLFVVAPRVPLFNYSLANYLAYAPPSPTRVQALVRRATAADGPRRDVYAAAFDRRVETQRKSLIVLLAAALALMLRALFAWRPAVPGTPRRYGEHLVFALHLLAFVWLALSAIYGIVALAQAPGMARTPAARTAVVVGLWALLLAIPLYAFRAVRLAYRLSLAQALGATVALVAIGTGLLLAYRTLLFFTTYYTL